MYVRVFSLAALVAAIALVTAPSAPFAVVTPDSGDPAGGTVVTFEGIHFTQIAAGSNFTLGLTSQGTV